MKLVVLSLPEKSMSLGSMRKDFKVETIGDSIHKSYVQFKGPEASKLYFHSFSFFSLMGYERIMLVTMRNARIII